MSERYISADWHIFKKMMIGGWKWSKWKFCHCRVSRDLHYTGNKNQQPLSKKGRAPSLPVRLFTSAPLVRTTAASSASFSENKRGVNLPKGNLWGAVEARTITKQLLHKRSAAYIDIYINISLHQSTKRGCTQEQAQTKGGHRDRKDQNIKGHVIPLYSQHHAGAIHLVQWIHTECLGA